MREQCPCPQFDRLLHLKYQLLVAVLRTPVGGHVDFLVLMTTTNINCGMHFSRAYWFTLSRSLQ